MTDPLIVENFAEYGVGVAFLVVRMIARLWVVGWQHLAIDDVFCTLAIIFYTLVSVNIYLLVGVYGSNIGLNAQTALQVPVADEADLIFGSKIAFMNWIWYISMIWSLKAMLLILYSRISTGLKQHLRIVQIVSCFTVATYLACLLTHICICVPSHRNWQIKPYPGDNCTVRAPNYYVICILNVVTDVCVLLIPFPILFKLQVPLYRKIALGFLFSSGFFVMIATILRAYYSLQSIETLPIALGWAVRETFVAAIAVSLPGIRPLFSKSRWAGSSASRTKKTGNAYAMQSGMKSSRNRTGDFGSSATYVDENKGFGMSSMSWKKNARQLSSNGSEEHIIESRNDDRNNAENDSNRGITVTTEYSVAHEEAGLRTPRLDSRR